MLAQTSLYGKRVDPPIRVYRREKEDKPWKGVCCKACWNAKGEKCRCRCDKVNHGKGHAMTVTADRDLAIDMNSRTVTSRLKEAEAEPFRKQITRDKCDCGYEGLSKRPIEFWGPHDGGWTVQDMKDKMWLYVTCPKCHYQWALWKLGVPRE